MLTFMPFAIGLAISIITIVLVYSLMPQVMGNFTCPSPEDYPDDEGAQAWAERCTEMKTQTATVPIIISLAIVISAVLLVTRVWQN